MQDISVWIAAGAAVVAAIIAAVTTAWLAPLFQHGIWKKQKLREQRLETAKQFQTFSRMLPILQREADTVQELTNRKQMLMDLKAAIWCIRVLFDRPETIEWCGKLQVAMVVDLSEHWEAAFIAREELVGRLYAEALGRKVGPNWFQPDPNPPN